MHCLSLIYSVLSCCPANQSFPIQRNLQTVTLFPSPLHIQYLNKITGLSSEGKERYNVYIMVSGSVFEVVYSKQGCVLCHFNHRHRLTFCKFGLHTLLTWCNGYIHFLFSHSLQGFCVVWLIFWKQSVRKKPYVRPCLLTFQVIFVISGIDWLSVVYTFLTWCIGYIH